MNISEVIEQAKAKYPVSVYYNGRLTEYDINELEKECEVHCSSVYMDGTGAYSIRYRKEQKQKSDVIYEYGCEITSTTECPLREEIRAEVIDEVIEALTDSMPLVENQDIICGFQCAIQRVEQLKEQNNE